MQYKVVSEVIEQGCSHMDVEFFLDGELVAEQHYCIANTAAAADQWKIDIKNRMAKIKAEVEAPPPPPPTKKKSKTGIKVGKKVTKLV